MSTATKPQPAGVNFATVAPKPRMLFLNLPVKDLQRSMQFFAKLGFSFNPQFTDETAAAMLVGKDAFVMLLSQPRFKDFVNRPVADPRAATGALFTFSADSREEVDKIVKTAVANGGSHAKDPQDHGFMYGWSFYDLDGHHWEVFWMDQAVVQK